jgi:hypothetical protein
MLAAVIRDGFASAHRRPGLILLDVFWKLIWLLLTTVAFLSAATWFTSSLRGIEWDDSGARALNGLIVATVLREFWNAKRAEILVMLIMVLAISALVWLVLEAFFRRRLADGASSYNIFLASGFLRSALTVLAGFVALLIWIAGAPAIGIVSFCAFAFLLTLLDSLIRADAVDLLGTDLIRVAGLIGILMSLEGLVTASFIAILAAGFLNVARAADALAMLGATAAVIVILSLLHSYLLLVRYSAIAIMRRNVVEV